MIHDLVFWNVENLFRPDTGGPRGDQTAQSGWTEARHQAKLDRVAEVLAQTDRQGKRPPLIALAEVEDAVVAADLRRRLPPEYQFAGPGSYPYYLDCVFFYDSSRFELLSTDYSDVLNRAPKGEILSVRLKEKKSGTEFTVYVIHFKSRYEGDEYTEPFRRVLCDHLQQLLHRRHGGDDGNAIVIGDFNDEPFSPGLLDYLLATPDREHAAHAGRENGLPMFNAAFSRLAAPRPGSLYHHRRRGTPWMLFDQALVSPALLTGEGGMLYRDDSFQVIDHLTADETGRPERCFRWTRETGKYIADAWSDHFPIRISLKF